MYKHIVYSLSLALATLMAGCSKGDTNGSGCDPNAANTICTIAGSGASGYAGDGKAATSALLYTPQATAWGPDGQLWLLDYNNYVVRSIDAKGVITTRVGIGELGDSPNTSQGQTESPAAEAKFNHTPDMTFSPDGKYLYLAAWHGAWIKKVELATMMVSDVAGEGVRTHYSGDGGPALMAEIDLPASVRVAPNGNIVFMDQGNQVIRQVDSTGNINRIAGTCLAEYYLLGDPVCTPASTTLQSCTGADDDRYTYCTPASADMGNQLSNFCAWACSPGFAGDGGPALKARLGLSSGQSADPNGKMDYDSAGNLYFTDTLNNRIRKIDTSGIITTIAGTFVPSVTPNDSLSSANGVGGYSGDGGPATQAELNHPVGIAIDTDNTIYFTDTNNNCVRKIDPTGIISTVVGDCTTSNLCGSVDASSCNADVGPVCQTDTKTCFKGDGGPPTSARLSHPYAVSLHGKKLYVSDTYNNRIRVVNLP